MTDQINRPIVVLASENKGKIRELQAMLGPHAEVRPGSTFGVVMPEETGSTFVENALLKAQAAHQQTGHTSLADDSGLSVDALHGEPGVYSARYSGDGATDERNNTKLLAALADTPTDQRSARFHSAIAIVTADGDEMIFEGTCEGAVGYDLVGDGGFGYDPLFVLPDGRTMGQLPPEEKNEISHRANAMKQAIPALQAYLRNLEGAR